MGVGEYRQGLDVRVKRAQESKSGVRGREHSLIKGKLYDTGEKVVEEISPLAEQCRGGGRGSGGGKVKHTAGSTFTVKGYLRWLNVTMTQDKNLTGA